MGGSPAPDLAVCRRLADTVRRNPGASRFPQAGFPVRGPLQGRRTQVFGSPAIPAIISSMIRVAAVPGKSAELGAGGAAVEFGVAIAGKVDESPAMRYLCTTILDPEG